MKEVIRFLGEGVGEGMEEEEEEEMEGVRNAGAVVS